MLEMLWHELEKRYLTNIFMNSVLFKRASLLTEAQSATNSFTSRHS